MQSCAYVASCWPCRLCFALPAGPQIFFACSVPQMLLGITPGLIFLSVFLADCSTYGPCRSSSGICGEDPMIFDLKSFAEMPRFRDERLEKVRHGGDTMKPMMRTSWVWMMFLNVII